MTDLKITFLTQDDVPSIVNAFAAIGWNKPATQYQKYLEEQKAGKRLVWVATQNGVFAGYVCLLWQSLYSHFKQQNIPEICDLNVLPTFRKQGIGSALLKQAEMESNKRSPIVGIAVGLTSDYMNAFRLYLRNGYTLCREGIFYRGKATQYSDAILVDDDLCLTLTKKVAV